MGAPASSVLTLKKRSTVQPTLSLSAWLTLSSSRSTAAAPVALSTVALCFRLQGVTAALPTAALPTAVSSTAMAKLSAYDSLRDR